MKKIAKLSLVAATAAASVLHAAGIKNATIGQKGSKLVISTGKGSSKNTILTIKQSDLKGLSSKSIAATLDPKSSTIAFSDPLSGETLFATKISKKLFAKIKKPVSFIVSYAHKHLTMQLSNESVPASAIMLTAEAKQILSDSFSMKLNDGKLNFAKMHIDLHSTIGSLIGCKETTCEIHDKTAKAIAANNPHYEKMLKKTA